MGLPGAPGWTMAGVEGPDCWAWDWEGKIATAAIPERNAAPRGKGRRGERKRRLPRERAMFRDDEQLFEQLELMMTYALTMEKFDG